MKALDRNIETLYIWTDSMIVYSWIINPALHAERFVTHCVGNILKDQKKFNAVEYYYINTKENKAVIVSCDISLTCDHDKIGLWLHGSELLCNPNLWQNPAMLPQNIMVLGIDDNVRKPEQQSAKHSDHTKICKTVAIFLAFRQYWIAMLRTENWQMDKDWQNQKFCFEVEFLKNCIDHSVNISVFELEAAEHEITKHILSSMKEGKDRIAK